jgi:hypothetical protein
MLVIWKKLSQVEVNLPNTISLLMAKTELELCQSCKECRAFDLYQSFPSEGKSAWSLGALEIYLAPRTK